MTIRESDSLARTSRRQEASRAAPLVPAGDRRASCLSLHLAPDSRPLCLWKPTSANKRGNARTHARADTILFPLLQIQEARVTGAATSTATTDTRRCHNHRCPPSPPQPPPSLPASATTSAATATRLCNHHRCHRCPPLPPQSPPPLPAFATTAAAIRLCHHHHRHRYPLSPPPPPLLAAVTAANYPAVTCVKSTYMPSLPKSGPRAHLPHYHYLFIRSHKHSRNAVPWQLNETPKIEDEGKKKKKSSATSLRVRMKYMSSTSLNF